MWFGRWERFRLAYVAWVFKVRPGFLGARLVALNLIKGQCQEKKIQGFDALEWKVDVVANVISQKGAKCSRLKTAILDPAGCICGKKEMTEFSFFPNFVDDRTYDSGNCKTRWESNENP